MSATLIDGTTVSIGRCGMILGQGRNGTQPHPFTAKTGGRFEGQMFITETTELSVTSVLEALRN